VHETRPKESMAKIIENGANLSKNGYIKLLLLSSKSPLWLLKMQQSASLIRPQIPKFAQGKPPGPPPPNGRGLTTLPYLHPTLV